jgi:hypothetical protein
MRKNEREFSLGRSTIAKQARVGLFRSHYLLGLCQQSEQADACFLHLSDNDDGWLIVLAASLLRKEATDWLRLKQANVYGGSK